MAGQMAHARPTLLLTRPAAASARFAERFAARFGPDWPVVTSPLTVLRFRDVPPPLDGVRTLVFTSEAGVEAFARLTVRRDFAAWCVGPRTAEQARAVGFAVREGPGDAGALIRAMVAARPAAPCLHVRGLHVAGDIADALNSVGIETLSAVLYDQAEEPMNTAASALLSGSRPVLLPLFSPRSARLLRVALPAAPAPLAVVAMSAAVADAVHGMGPEHLRVAARPDAGGMLDALGELIADLAT